MRFTVVIPARWQSTRLPGKPLLEIAGKPMIRHVHERALESGAERIIITTDDDRIRDCCQGFGAEVVMTAADCASGTDRIAAALSHSGLPEESIVVNLQGDEPQLPGALIRQVAELLQQSSLAEMATLSEPLESYQDLLDPNVVKVVSDQQGLALYFSRAPIPWDRQQFNGSTADSISLAQSWQRHIGLYAYRLGFLQSFTRMPACELERLEQLEQLRALHYGARIAIAPAQSASGFGVDTHSDLERVRKLMSAGE